MKKLSFLFLFVICSCALFAQTVTVHTTVKNDMRIFVKDGEEVITAFPSKYLKTDVNIGVILPQGYEKRQSPFPVVYVLGQNLVNKKQVEENFYFRKNDNPQAVFVSVLMPARPVTSAQMAEFFTLELLPYFEVNYKVSSYPKERVLAVSGPLAVKGLEIVSSKGDYFKNLALILLETTPLPALPAGLQDDIKVWAAGNLSNMIRLQTLLENSGLKFPTGFAYKFAAADKNKNIWSDINLNYLLNADTRKVKKAKVHSSLESFSLAQMPSAEVWIDVTLGGYEVNYVPTELKSAPPFFNWEYSTAHLTPIYGADEGIVNVFGALPSGKPFAVDLKLVK